MQVRTKERKQTPNKQLEQRLGRDVMAKGKEEVPQITLAKGKSWTATAIINGEKLMVGGHAPMDTIFDVPVKLRNSVTYKNGVVMHLNTTEFSLLAMQGKINLKGDCGPVALIGFNYHP